ncbi:thiamine phosphate synthase [Acidicapsa dinghuensis]|uniref:Thiamine-phosphate synthase n=1 Tax=Acidicapsa dinghuensis TaxID=2218256 RepID=A0ABW1EGE7_9BACT|nr:thiamine phosphate synthase [Acidicapsa dinghuensis]
MRLRLPKVYPILDSSTIPAGPEREVFLDRLGKALADAGVELLEYRNKPGSDADVYTDARVLRAAMPDTKLVMDDRVDVALAAGFNGVHVDLGDLPVEVARKLMGPGALIGTSAGAEGVSTIADYVAFGPVFPTTTKQTPLQPIGIEGVRRFRVAAGPDVVLVAAAGITLETAPHILSAGADAVAVSAAIFRAVDPATEFRRWLKQLG